jgi:hypothetical protein
MVQCNKTVVRFHKGQNKPRYLPFRRILFNLLQGHFDSLHEVLLVQS